MAIHLPIGPLKPALGWSRYRDANPVADDIMTAPSGTVDILGGGWIIPILPSH